MTFRSTHVSVAAPVAARPVVWMRRVPGASPACLALKCAVFAALVIALADPWAPMREEKLAVTVLMDTSASMPRESLQRGEAMLRDLVRKNQARICD